jgi:hypothetical protein
MTASPDQLSHWLQLAKVNLFIDNTAASSYGSALDTAMSLTVNRPCSIDNCVGCTDLGLQRLCYAAQQCQLARCIGTMVHQQRPLCAIGMYLESLIRQDLSMVEGAWLVVSESVVGIIGTAGGVNPPTSVNWPDQAFYGYICSAKDVSATAIAIVTSSIGGIVQAAGQTPFSQSAGQTHLITNNAMILFTMTMMATTNFLHQLALAPLYSTIALQKTFMCEVNSVLAVVASDLSSITLGDASITPYTSRASGKCVSQYQSENTQGEGSGTQNSKSLMSAALSKVLNLAMVMKMEPMIHSLDAGFTWAQGVVSGLEDIVQTVDRSRWGHITAHALAPFPSSSQHFAQPPLLLPCGSSSCISTQMPQQQVFGGLLGGGLGFFVFEGFFLAEGVLVFLVPLVGLADLADSPLPPCRKTLTSMSNGSGSSFSSMVSQHYPIFNSSRIH